MRSRPGRDRQRAFEVDAVLCILECHLFGGVGKRCAGRLRTYHRLRQLERRRAHRLERASEVQPALGEHAGRGSTTGGKGPFDRRAGSRQQERGPPRARLHFAPGTIEKSFSRDGDSTVTVGLQHDEESPRWWSDQPTANQLQKTPTGVHVSAHSGRVTGCWCACAFFLLSRSSVSRAAPDLPRSLRAQSEASRSKNERQSRRRAPPRSP